MLLPAGVMAVFLHLFFFILAASCQDRVEEADVVIIGTGPVGATFARDIVTRSSLRVVMVEAGAYLSFPHGRHLSNQYPVQREPLGSGETRKYQVSEIPEQVDPRAVAGIDPNAFVVRRTFLIPNENPNQDPELNLPGAEVAYAVGGSGIVWGIVTPRLHPEVELPEEIPKYEWDRLYDVAEDYFNVHRVVYNSTFTLRALRDIFEDSSFTFRHPPLAAERRRDNPEWVEWTGVDTILGPLVNWHGISNRYEDRFKVLANTRGTRLNLNEDKTSIESLLVTDLIRAEDYTIRASVFVVACSSLLTPQVLWNSGIRPYPLGRYLMDQPMAVAGIVLFKEVVDLIAQKAREAGQIADDITGIPKSEIERWLLLPVDEENQIQCEIYNWPEAGIDPRVLLDILCFSMQDPHPENRVYYDESLRDRIGMPQATFEYRLEGEDRLRANQMLQFLTEIASTLGDFRNGSEPEFLPPGASIHWQGTYRMGRRNDNQSVTDTYSKVWDIDNLYLGGAGLIPNAIAANPTLTAAALAVRASRQIIERFEPDYD